MVRHYYFLIWGHGLPYLEEMLEVIRAEPGMAVKKIFIRRLNSVKRLVKTVYSMDYAPFSHLRAKTRYLLETPNEAAFVFVGLEDPERDYFGDGQFRHAEALPIKRVKEAIRERWNPRHAGVRGEEHVVHASDNEHQTAHMLEVLGFAEGLDLFQPPKRTLDAPDYLGPVDRFQVRTMSLDELDCSILQGDRYDFSHVRRNLADSPHYQGLTQDMDIYQAYVERFRGVALTEDYGAEKFRRLQAELAYLQAPYEGRYVIVREDEQGCLVRDGLHRAAILKASGAESIRVVSV